MRRSAFVLLALLCQCGVVADKGWEHYGGKMPVVAVHGSHGERSR